MVPHTSPVHYYSEEIYNLEKEKIFYKTWQFACLYSQVKNHNDFVTFELCDKAVVVQNFQGELRAFSNVCSHRYARIQNEPCGNRMLRCPYHAWTYNKEGVPIGIPCKEDFENLNLQEFALERFELEILGNIVFVKIIPDEGDLKTYLGGMFERIKEIANSLDDIYDTYTLEVDCNWKLPIENSLEGYHVDSVHSATIKIYFEDVAKISEYSTIDLPDICFDSHNFYFSYPHSYLARLVDVTELQKWKKISNLVGDRHFNEKDYSHHNLFPNFNIATFYGSAFFLQIFRPISAEKCMISHFSVSAKRINNSLIGDHIYNETIKGGVSMGKSILDEDIDICLRVQEGCRRALNHGILSKEEGRVGLFQKAYMNYLQ